jgi:eukaryotic-like serine/threonine-protein kinase
VPDPVVSSADAELRAHIERVLSAHYELDREIGRGGFGIVYRAKDRRLKRTVAIKILPPELAFRSEIKTRFLREAETAAQLSHPNIVPIYSVDEAEGIVYFVMAYVSGDNLAKRLHDRGVLPVDETRRILRDVADALAYAHERGVVHRDIKPDNILLDEEHGRPMVTDFGIARAVSDGGDSRLTATGMAIGTPAYMSPEQAAGERDIDGRSDLYSLGILGYQMLVGEPPFMASSTPAILVKHISERPVPIEQRRADVPVDLARAIMLMLEKDPANRFPSASALVIALDSGTMPTGPRISGAGAPNGADTRSAAYPDSSGISRRSSGTFGGGVSPTFGGQTGGAGSYSLASPVPGADLGVDVYTPSADDIRRWEAPEVQKFRKKVAPYLFVNGVIVLASLFGDGDFLFFTVVWSIWMAFKYARLWSESYDWRDVFRQPRDRELIDVFDEGMERVRALFDRNRRKALRERNRARQIARRSGASTFGGVTGSPLPQNIALSASGPYSARVRQAAIDRDEIIQMVDRMSPNDRQRLPDVVRSAIALHDKIQALAVSLADLDRSSVPGGGDALEAEIAKLEGAANPLEAGSEERVRRLAFLKRQRRAIVDVSKKRELVANKLETCSLALQNMRLDVMRLHAGAESHQHITSLAMDALNLAQSVDGALYVADELGRATGRQSTRTSASKG